MEAYQEQQWQSIKNGVFALGDPAFQTPHLKRLRTDLEAANKVIDDLYSAQARDHSVAWDGEELDRLRVRLREHHLMVISEDARLLLEGLPGVDDFFHVPHKRVSDQDLLAAADRVLRNAKDHERVFVKGGFAKDFIRKAQAAVDALKAKLDDGDTKMNRRSRATSSLPAAIAKGRKIMRAIDRAVAAELADDALARARWARAMRIPQKVGRPKNNRRARRVDPPSE